MILFNKLGLNAYYGASLSTMLGYVVSLIICFVDLKKQFNIDFKKIFKSILIGLVAATIMYIIIYLLKSNITFGSSRLISILEISIYALVGALTYIVLLIRTKTFKEIIKLLRR